MAIPQRTRPRRALAIDYAALPDDALLRADEVHRPRGPYPGGRSCWWQAVRSGDAPQPIRYGRMTVWRWGDVRAYLRRIAERGAA